MAGIATVDAVKTAAIMAGTVTDSAPSTSHHCATSPGSSSG